MQEKRLRNERKRKISTSEDEGHQDKNSMNFTNIPKPPSEKIFGNISKQNSTVTYAKLPPPSYADADTKMLNDKPGTYNTKNEYFDTEMNCFTIIPVTYRC